MKPIRWDPHQSDWLQQTRGLSFEELMLLGTPVEETKSPSRSHQRLLLIELEGYIWVIAFVETPDEIFFKTLYPSRKYTRHYRERMDAHEDTPEENKTDPRGKRD